MTKQVVQGDFDVRLPYGRPINPITGANWEGTGVEPHIAVPAEEALKTAHLDAVERLAAQCPDKSERYYLSWIAEIIASDYSPVVLDKADLSRRVGAFGQRRFFIASENLLLPKEPGGKRTI